MSAVKGVLVRLIVIFAVFGILTWAAVQQAERVVVKAVQTATR